MIPFAVVAALVCLGILGYDVFKRAGNPYAAMRIPVAGAWGAGLLTYGINPASFPHPSAETLLVLSVTCAGALLMTPLGHRLVRSSVPTATGSAVADWYRVCLLVLAGGLVVWDLYFIIDLVDSYGWTAGLSQHRINRGEKAGAYAIPGSEVLHAIAAAAGALGFADWLKSRRATGLAATALGLATALFSSGRWDVVGHVVWLFAIYGFLTPPSGYVTIAKQAVLYALLAAFFVVHGQLLGKLEGAAILANSSTSQRAEQASQGVPQVMSAGLTSQATSAPAAVTPESVPTCERWTEGATQANLGFRGLSRVTRVFVLYLVGPFATLDRALCEGRAAQRTVLMYWPHKVLRIVGLRDPEALMVVDPFLDIGIPFNNYTAIYQFLSEVGPRLGLVAWLLFGIFINLFSAWCLGHESAWGVVAGTAAMSMAVRTPWGNTFFDGTLVVWIAVALGPAMIALYDTATRPAPTQS
jgi:hypothetical protein